MQQLIIDSKSSTWWIQAIYGSIYPYCFTQFPHSLGSEDVTCALGAEYAIRSHDANEQTLPETTQLRLKIFVCADKFLWKYLLYFKRLDLLLAFTQDMAWCLAIYSACLFKLLLREQCNNRPYSPCISHVKKHLQSYLMHTLILNYMLFYSPPQEILSLSTRPPLCVCYGNHLLKKNQTYWTQSYTTNTYHNCWMKHGYNLTEN